MNRIIRTAITFAFSFLLVSPALGKTKAKRKPTNQTMNRFCFSKTFKSGERTDFGDVDTIRVVASPGQDGETAFVPTGVSITKDDVLYSAGFECFTKTPNSRWDKYRCRGIEDNGTFQYAVKKDKSKAVMKIQGDGLALGFVGDPTLDYQPRLKTIILEKCEDI